MLVQRLPADMEAASQREAEAVRRRASSAGRHGLVRRERPAANRNGAGGSPAGTGDDLAKVGKSAVRLLANPKFAAIDAVRLETGESTRYFVNVAGAGFDSEVNETANGMSLNLGGTGTYVAALITTLRRFSPASYRVTLDGETISLDAMLVVVAAVLLRRRREGAAERVGQRRPARCLHRRSAVDRRFPARIPQGVHGLACHSSQGSDDDRTFGSDRGGPCDPGLR